MCYTEVILNGEPVPGQRTPVKNMNIMLETYINNDERLLIIKAEREAHTRAVLHTHKDGGVTCILSGEMTLYMEGCEPQTAKANSCYYMPSDTKMLAYNSENTTTELIDFFINKKGNSALTPLECDFPISDTNPYLKIA
jgi:quercetin dioxygenase-like cupin family protein